MSLHQHSSSFRRAGFVLAAIAGASVLAAFPAAAQQAGTVGISGSPNCAAYAKDSSAKGFKSEMQCEIRESDRRINENVRSTNENIKRGAAADQEVKCAETMMNGIRNGAWSKDVVLRVYAGRPVTQVSSCEVLGKLPRPSAGG
jgi:hypothetical protein